MRKGSKGFDNNKILAVTGPTAVGKTEYTLQLAEVFDGEIISCDSMQIYRYMDIGSAKPRPEELERVPHHMIDVADPFEDFSVARYQEMAGKAIDSVLKKGKLPILSGGTGLYMDSIIFDLDFGPGRKDDAFRKSLEEIAGRDGPEALYKRLEKCDPRAAERIHPNNVKRVIRAIEAAELFHDPIGDFEDTKRKKNDDYDVTLIGLKREREQLYERVNDRVDRLMEAGLLDEIKRLKDMGLSSRDISMKGIGYKELIDHLDGLYDIDEAVRLIKRNTRRFAKRQMTWFARYEDIRWFDITDDGPSTLEDIVKWLRKKM